MDFLTSFPPGCCASFLVTVGSRLSPRQVESKKSDWVPIPLHSRQHRPSRMSHKTSIAFSLVLQNESSDFSFFSSFSSFYLPQSLNCTSRIREILSPAMIFTFSFKFLLLCNLFFSFSGSSPSLHACQFFFS